MDTTSAPGAGQPAGTAEGPQHMAELRSELLPLLPLDDAVVLPHMTVTLAVEGEAQRAAIEAARRGSMLVLLAPRVDGQFSRVGTIARVEDSGEMPDGTPVTILRGEQRARLGGAQADVGGSLWVQGDPVPDPEQASEKAQELAREYRTRMENLLEA